MVWEGAVEIKSIAYFIAGKLEYNHDAYCDHHGEDHKCGEYNCVK